MGEYQREIDDLTSAIKLQPKNATLYEKRADAFYKLVQLQNAIQDSTTAIKLNPNSATAYRTAATSYDELRIYAKAIDTRTNLIKRNLHNAIDLSERANDYETVGNSAAAQADWRQSIKIASPAQRIIVQLNAPLINLRTPTNQAPKRLIDEPLKTNPITLPFHYDAGGKICIAAHVNGLPVELMLDTGCSRSDIWRVPLLEHAKTFNVHPTTSQLGTRYQSGIFRLRELRLGTLVLRNIAMAIDTGLGHHRTLIGFLGGNVLQNCAVSIDYAKKQVTFAAASNVHPSSNAIDVPIIIRDHTPFCAVTLDNQLTYPAQIDTGSPYSCAPDSLVRPILRKALSCTTVMNGPFIGTVPVEYLRFKSLAVGTQTIKDPMLAVFRAEIGPYLAMHLALGNSFLSRFKAVTFNYPAGKLILEPNDVPTSSAFAFLDEASFYEGRNEFEKALNAYETAMSLEPDITALCHWRRSQLFFVRKQYREAILELDAALKLEPEWLPAYLIRAQCYGHIGDYVREIADYSTLIRLQPKNMPAYCDRACAYEKLGQHDLANRDRATGKKFYKQWIEHQSTW